MLVMLLLTLTRQGCFCIQSRSFRTSLHAFARWDPVQSRDLTARMESGWSCSAQKPLVGYSCCAGGRGAFPSQLYQVGERCYSSEEARDMGLSRSQAGPEDSDARGLCRRWEPCHQKAAAGAWSWARAGPGEPTSRPCGAAGGTRSSAVQAGRT